jgi:hypothetical protein
MLAPRNTRLSLAMFFDGPVKVKPVIETERIEKGRGKPKAVSFLPSFCPFCGEKYPSDAAIAAAEAK